MSSRGVSAYRVLVPVTALGAGLLFALSASSAQGTDLRAERREVTDLIGQQQRDVEALEAQALRLRAQVAAAAADAAQHEPDGIGQGARAAHDRTTAGSSSGPSYAGTSSSADRDTE